MEATKSRAAVVALRDERLLVIRRVKHGRRYAILPGGGVEMSERAEEAALRELTEETGLVGDVLRHLWSLEHADRQADYFLVAVPVAAMVMSGPECTGMSTENTYEPCWIHLSDLDTENPQPVEVRDLVRQLVDGS